MEKYIKADTVLQFINGCLAHEDKITEIEKAVLTGVKLYVERIPAVDVAEVRHGRWIPEYGSMDRVDYWHCSVCDSNFQYIGVTSLYDYCPNCGAKMDGGINE